MKRFCFALCAKFLLFGVVFVLIGGAVTMVAWNYVIPFIFSVGTITYWQAVALLVLARVLFWRGWGGGHHGGWQQGGGPGWQNSPYFKRMMEKRFAKMTPEQQEKVKQYWEHRCGGWKSKEKNPFPGGEEGQENKG